MSTHISPILASFPTLYDKETKEISEKFKKQLIITGLATENFDRLTVNKVLQEKCYQEDFDFYLKGNDNPEFPLSYPQAKAFLDLENKDRKAILPEKSEEPVNGVMCSGVFETSCANTLFNRFQALEYAMNNGVIFNKVAILCKNTHIAQLSKEYILKEYSKEKFKNITFVYIVANVGKNIGLTALGILKKDGDFSKSYVVISDPTSIEKDLLDATQTLESPCLGCAVKPLPLWMEMALYNYTKEKLGTSEKAMIAWVKSKLNFMARTLNKELTSNQFIKI